MEENEDIVTELNSLRNKIDDLEIRVSQVLSKQLQTKKELELMREKPEVADEPVDEETCELVLPEDYHFTEDLQRIFRSLMENQKALMDSVQSSKEHRTGLKGQKIFQDMSRHLSDRFEYLEMSKALVEGPLLEEPPPPPPEEEEKEEPIPEEPPKEEKGSKSKAKKSKAKK